MVKKFYGEDTLFLRGSLSVHLSAYNSCTQQWHWHLSMITKIFMHDCVQYCAVRIRYYMKCMFIQYACKIFRKNFILAGIVKYVQTDVHFQLNVLLFEGIINDKFIEVYNFINKDIKVSICILWFFWSWYNSDK